MDTCDGLTATARPQQGGRPEYGWKVAPRDRFLRWTPKRRAARLHLIVDQSTFLILPWVKVQFLASSLLGQVARRLAADWRALCP